MLNRMKLNLLKCLLRLQQYISRSALQLFYYFFPPALKSRCNYRCSVYVEGAFVFPCLHTHAAGGRCARDGLSVLSCGALLSVGQLIAALWAAVALVTSHLYHLLIKSWLPVAVCCCVPIKQLQLHLLNMHK